MERNSQSAIRHTGLASSVPSPEEALDKGSGMADVGEVVERMEHAGEATRISTESKRMVLHEPRIRHREERSKPTRGALITGDESSEKSRPKKRLRQEAEFPESRNHTKTIKPESIEPTKVLEKDNAFLKRDDVALRRSAAGTSKERLAGAEPNVKKKDREKAKDKKSKKRKKGDVIDDLFAGLD